MKLTAEDLRRRVNSFGIVSRSRLVRSWAPKLAGVLVLTDQLSDDLVFETAQARADWVSHLSELRFTVDAWRGGDVDAIIDSSVLDALVELALGSWRGPSSTKEQFPFVKNETLKLISERDFRSLQVALKQDEWKSAVILAGSVVEAMLIDVVEQESLARNAVVPSVPKKNTEKPEHWTLHELVSTCGPAGIGRLGDRTVRAADLVRDYRNFVHPGLELRTGDRVSGQDARLSGLLVEMIVADLK